MTLDNEQIVRKVYQIAEDKDLSVPGMHRELYQLYVGGNIVVVQLALQGTASTATPRARSSSPSSA